MLDLFAGSGALGFEALSRGAAHAFFVDQSRDAEHTILKNAETLGVSDQVKVICHDVLKVGPKLEPLLREGPADLVIADPPYEKGFETQLLALVRPWTKVGSILVIESSARTKSKDTALPENAEGWTQIRDREYGDTRLTHYERV